MDARVAEGPGTPGRLVPDRVGKKLGNNVPGAWNETSVVDPGINALDRWPITILPSLC